MAHCEPSTQRGMARVEFIALKPEIEELLGKGHTNKFIHETLFATGRITMSYRMFCRYVVLFFPKSKCKPQSRRANFTTSAPSPSSPVPVGSESKGKKIFHDKEQPAKKVLDFLA